MALFALQWHNCLYSTKTFIKAYFISVTKYLSYESRNKSQNSKPEIGVTKPEIKFLRKLRLHISFLKTNFEFLLKEPTHPPHRAFSNRANQMAYITVTKNIALQPRNSPWHYWSDKLQNIHWIKDWIVRPYCLGHAVELKMETQNIENRRSRSRIPDRRRMQTMYLCLWLWWWKNYAVTR